jgi:hypothetical protein
MRVASGRIIDGRVELVDAEFPEGAIVTVLFPDEEDAFKVDAETERMLLESIAEGDRGETFPLEQVMEELRRRD